MADSNGRIGPWSNCRFAIEGEPLAKDGLRKRRAALEEIVSPLVTAKKTADEIQFQGKRRYLINPVFSLDKKRHHAVRALQFLYNIESAWKAGDIDKVVCAAVGFATFDKDVMLVGMTGVDSVEGAFATARRQQMPSNGGKATAKKYRKRTDKNEILARRIFSEFYQGKVTKDAAYTRTLHKLAQEHQITMKRTTLQTIVKSPSA